jgi:micrococcal nuclease
VLSCLRVFVSAVAVVLAAASAVRASSQQPAPEEARCVVGQVADGDTFRCVDGRKVRLIGIDSPERGQRPYGAKARQALLRLLPTGTGVILEYDVSSMDRYGRVLAYVWAGPTLINEAMVRGGWAVLYTVPPNVKYAGRFGRAQNEARARSTGLWAEKGFDCLPIDFRIRRCLSSP